MFGELETGQPQECIDDQEAQRQRTNVLTVVARHKVTTMQIKDLRGCGRTQVAFLFRPAVCKTATSDFQPRTKTT